jgi:hypothetical protein
LAHALQSWLQQPVKIDFSQRLLRRWRLCAMQLVKAPSSIADKVIFAFVLQLQKGSLDFATQYQSVDH